MILEDRTGAIERADMMARELCLARRDLEGIGAWVRVVDEDNQEVYRTPVDPVPRWSISTVQK
jgi:hypothetical protein